jgi:hypothetical protein
MDRVANVVVIVVIVILYHIEISLFNVEDTDSIWTCWTNLIRRGDSKARRDKLGRESDTVRHGIA